MFIFRRITEEDNQLKLKTGNEAFDEYAPNGLFRFFDNLFLRKNKDKKREKGSHDSYNIKKEETYLSNNRVKG